MSTRLGHWIRVVVKPLGRAQREVQNRRLGLHWFEPNTRQKPWLGPGNPGSRAVAGLSALLAVVQFGVLCRQHAKVETCAPDSQQAGGLR